MTMRYLALAAWVACLAGLFAVPYLESSADAVRPYLSSGSSSSSRHGVGRRLDDDAPDDLSPCEANHTTCEAALQNCALGTDSSQLFDYYSFHYCVMAGAPAASYVILFGWLLIVFSLLASTADNFFVPSLETLSGELKLSPAVAHVCFVLA